MTAKAYGLSTYPSSHVPKNMFLHRLEAQSVFVPKLCRHGGKTIGYSSLKNRSMSFITMEGGG